MLAKLTSREPAEPQPNAAPAVEWLDPPAAAEPDRLVIVVESPARHTRHDDGVEAKPLGIVERARRQG